MNHRIRQLLKLAPLVAALLLSRPASAQSDIGFGANWQCQSGYNPAAIARPGYLYLFTDASRQWSGIAGAPQVVRLQASQYIDRLNAAFGFSLTGDAIGVSRAWNPMLHYAYRIAIEQKKFISMGLSTGLFSRSVNGTLFESGIDGDPAIAYENRRIIRPDVNAGVEYQSPHLVIGLATTHLLALANRDSLMLTSNHRYASVVYRDTGSDLYSWYLGLQVINRQNLFVGELSACLRIKHPTGLMSGPADLFEVGITLRSSRQLSAMFGLFVTPDLRVGYIYNQSFIPGYYGNGGHEVMVEYRVKRRDT